MNRKGFTLAELLGVIVILGVVALIAIPAVNQSIKNSKEASFQAQLKQIEKSAKDWALIHTESLPTEEGSRISLSLSELKRGGYLAVDFHNPKTGKLFPNDLMVSIERKSSQYIVTFDPESGSDTDTVDMEAPTILLKGNYLEYGEISSTGGNFADPGVIAKKKDGTEIPTSEIIVQYQTANQEVSDISLLPANIGKVYTVTYTATDNGHRAQAQRTVILRDTTAPVLIVPANETVTLTNLSSISLSNGVTVSDNSGKTITPVISGNISNYVGEYIITYTATDESGNSTVKKRIITVINETLGEILRNSTIVTTGSGLYKIGEEYRFRGGCNLSDNPGNYSCSDADPVNNYVSINGQQYRIIVMDSQGVKVMTQNEVTSMHYDKGTGNTSCTADTCPRNNAQNTFCQVTSGTYRGCNVYAAPIGGTFTAGGKTGTVTQNSTLYDYLNTSSTEAAVTTLRNVAKSASWNIGAVTEGSNVALVTIRSQEAAAKANFKLGLINTSDYIQGSLDSSCASDPVNYTAASEACRNQNWIFPSTDYPWTINAWTNTAGNSYFVWNVNTYYGALSNGSAYNSYGVRPVGYLSSDIQVTGGTGTEADPWVLNP